MVPRFYFAYITSPRLTSCSVEKKDKELQERIAMVQKDKLKIESTIQELDREKLEALNTTWTKVNESVIYTYQAV